MNRIIHMRKHRERESGNALFLILIAVTLFAALSYAVTQSGRGGSHVASNESNLITSSQITQYPAGIRTGITRMLIRGASVSSLDFSAPSDSTYEDDPVNEVFHPSGGGVMYQNIIPDTVTNIDDAEWAFSNDTTITYMATSEPDVVAMLTYVKEAVCAKINESVTGDPAIPDSGLGLSSLIQGGQTLTGENIDGQPFLCVSTDNGGNKVYVYYHVLVEQ